MMDRKPGALDRTSGAIRLAAQDAGSLIKRGLADFQHVRKARGYGLDARQAKELGSAHMKGLGVDQDDAEAVKWFRCAAEQGDAEAQHRVGFAYMTGRGISQDDAEAVKWFRLAARQGDAEAQYWMGYAFAKGIGVRPNEAAAARWYRLAAEQGLDSSHRRSGVSEGFISIEVGRERDGDRCFLPLDRLGRIDEEMVEILNKLSRGFKLLRRELGRDPTPEDFAERANLPSSVVREARKIARTLRR